MNMTSSNFSIKSKAPNNYFTRTHYVTYTRVKIKTFKKETVKTYGLPYLFKNTSHNMGRKYLTSKKNYSVWRTICGTEKYSPFSMLRIDIFTCNRYFYTRIICCCMTLQVTRQKATYMLLQLSCH
jgi:hypothetical protein